MTIFDKAISDLKSNNYIIPMAFITLIVLLLLITLMHLDAWTVYSYLEDTKLIGITPAIELSLLKPSTGLFIGAMFMILLFSAMLKLHVLKSLISISCFILAIDIPSVWFISRSIENLEISTGFANLLIGFIMAAIYIVVSVVYPFYATIKSKLNKPID